MWVCGICKDKMIKVCTTWAKRLSNLSNLAGRENLLEISSPLVQLHCLATLPLASTMDQVYLFLNTYLLYRSQLNVRIPSDVFCKPPVRVDLQNPPAVPYLLMRLNRSSIYYTYRYRSNIYILAKEDYRFL